MANKRDDFLRIVWSGALRRGLRPGFAFIFRPGRLIGAQRATANTVQFDLRDMVAVATHGGGPGELKTPPTMEEALRVVAEAGIDLSAADEAYKEAQKILETLEKGKRFELASDHIELVEITKPTWWRAGRIAIHTSGGDEVVRVSPRARAEEKILTDLIRMFETLAPGRVVRRT